MHTSVPLMSRVLLNWHSGLAMLFILLLEISMAKSDFTIIPQMSIVGAGAAANFRCRHQSRNTFWLVNGTELVIGNTSPDITIEIVNDGVNSLNIVGKLEYNGTMVQCGASNSNPLEVTPNVTLLVQGSLDRVSNVTRTLTAILWIPPFSLNLTNIEPDIIYCVEVYNITCGGGSLVVSDCSVTMPHFMDASVQPGYIYNITITPRSNVETASNGTSLTKEENFVFLNEPNIIFQYGTSSDKARVGIKLRLNTTVGSVEPASHFLTLQSADGVIESPKIWPTTFTKIFGSSTVSLKVSQPLSARRLWECRVFAFSCNKHPITDSFELSTHEFQNILVTSPASGNIVITGDFIAGSEAVGLLIIAYSLSNDSFTKYSFVPRSVKGPKNTMGLSIDQYNVSVFVVEENGLPFNRSATRPRNVFTMREKAGKSQQNSMFDYELHSTSTGVCITCTFLDSSTTDCVAVVHQRISQLSSSGLMNIESFKLNRSDGTAYGCIEGVNLTNYQVGAVGIYISQTGQERSSRLMPGEIAAIVIVLCLLLLFIMAGVIIILHFKKHISLPRRHTRRITQSEAHLLDTTQQEQVKDDGPSVPTNIALQEFKKGHKSSKDLVYTSVSPTAKSQIPPPAADKVKYTPIGGFKSQHGLHYAQPVTSTQSALVPDNLHKGSTPYAKINDQLETDAHTPTGQEHRHKAEEAEEAEEGVPTNTDVDRSCSHSLIEEGQEMKVLLFSSTFEESLPAQGP